MSGDVVLGNGSVLQIDAEQSHNLTVLRARRVIGRFDHVVTTKGYRATVSYTRTTVTVQLHRI